MVTTKRLVKTLGLLTIFGLTLAAGSYVPLRRASAQGKPAAQDKPAAQKQSVLGPGLYIFQTRIRSSSCGDAEPDGYVVSYLATLDGVPGAVSMAMDVLNTKHFKRWTLKISGSTVAGESRLAEASDAPDSHFTVEYDEKGRFKGTGYRTYNGTLAGKPQRCRVEYDALLRRLDT